MSKFIDKIKKILNTTSFLKAGLYLTHCRETDSVKKELSVFTENNSIITTIECPDNCISCTSECHSFDNSKGGFWQCLDNKLPSASIKEIKYYGDSSEYGKRYIGCISNGTHPQSTGELVARYDDLVLLKM